MKALSANPLALAHRFHAPGVGAIALLGSQARGDAGPFSDIDLVRFIEDEESSPPASGSHLIDGNLVVVSDVRPSQVEKWFSLPTEAVAVVAGLRLGVPLIDPDGLFQTIQHRAMEFTWDEAMQAKAYAYAGEQMVGLIEEVHKGLEGLRRDDIGRLLNARFGLSWLLSRLMQVARGVLSEGDNDFYRAMAEAMGLDSDWTRLHAEAFGVAGSDGDPDGNPPTLRQSVVAGLRLYALTFELLENDLPPEHRVPAKATADRIRYQLQQISLP